MVIFNQVLLRIRAPRKSLGLWICLGFLFGWLPHLSSDEIDFESAIAPIFASSCLKCHGPDEPAAELDLTSPESVADLEILKKDSDGEIPLLSRLRSDDPDWRMPPEGPRVEETHLESLQVWIESGADWPVHWSYQPLRRTPAPHVLGKAGVPNAANAIDAWIDQRLHEKNLTRSGLADKRTRIRRLTLGLWGMLPDPQDVQEFIDDKRPDAWERQVDRLLASPHYGERWARRWMDLVHFAETHGHDQDRPREHSWPYRDYLIRSFNSDKSYSTLIHEQLAGDRFYPNDPDALEGLGMLAAGPWDESSLRDIREDSVDREKGRYLDRDDIVTTVMSTFASTSAHCARCHDHKFDPVSQVDYYGLQSIFADTDKANRTYDRDAETADRRREIQQQIATLETQIAGQDRSLLHPDNLIAARTWESEQASGLVDWLKLAEPQAEAAGGSQLQLLDDGSWLASGAKPEREIYTIRGKSPIRRVTAIRLELLPDESLPALGPGRAENGNLHISEIRCFRKGEAGQWTLLEFKDSKADFDQTGWTLAMAYDGNPNSAWGIHPEIGKRHVGVVQFKQPLSLVEGDEFRVELHQLHGGGHLVGRFSLAVTDGDRPLDDPTLAWEDHLRRILAKSEQERDDSEKIAWVAHVQKKRLESERSQLPPLSMIYCGTSQFVADGSFRPAGAPRDVFVLHRGQIDQPGELAVPHPPAGVYAEGWDNTVESSSSGLERRQALADWLTHEHNGLTWRSMANRLWQAQIGKPLVATPNDFGHMGARPTHPQLLDGLASDLLRYQGSLKRLQREILCSQTYQQSSAATAAGREIDGGNQFLWHMNRRRLDAEVFRDSLLEASGRLDRRMGGPSVKAFVQSPGVHVTPVVNYGAFDLEHPGNRRRSVYRFIFRTIPDPLMEALDCPDASQLSPKRNESVTVLQALATWNDRFVLHLCQEMAKDIEAWENDHASRCQAVYSKLFQRLPNAEELESVTNYADEFGWANAIRVLINSNEFMFVD
jgi:hypothetical protein